MVEAQVSPELRSPNHAWRSGEKGERLKKQIESLDLDVATHRSDQNMYLPQVWGGVPAKFAGDTLGLEHSGMPLFEAVSYMVFRLHPAELQHLLNQHGLQDAMTQMLGALEDAQENKFRKEAADMLANLDDMDFDGRW